MLLSENGDWEDSVGRRQLLVRNHVTWFIYRVYVLFNNFPAILREKIDCYLRNVYRYSKEFVSKDLLKIERKVR